MSGSYDAGLIPVFTTQYTTNLELLLQQKGSKLRGKVAEGMHVGKMASPIQQIAPITAQKPKGRFAPKDRVDTNFVRRWVFPTAADVNQLIDSFDELQTIIDPKSAYTQNAANAFGRAWDDEILASTTRTAYIGQDAASLTQETFDTTKFQIAANFEASAPVGMTVAKLIEAKRLFRHYHNDLDSEEVTFIGGSKQESDLLKQTQVVSTEYNDRPVLVDGKLTRFMGFNLVFMERVPETTASTTRGCLAFVKSGLYLGMWRDLTNRISIRNDLTSEPWQLYSQAMYGGTRTQPGKVLQILCADTTGADVTP
jgi:hypothetical protein